MNIVIVADSDQLRCLKIPFSGRKDVVWVTREELQAMYPPKPQVTGAWIDEYDTGTNKKAPARPDKRPYYRKFGGKY